MHRLSGCSRGHLHSVMSEPEAHALFSQGVENFHPIALNGRITASPVRVNQHGIRILECRVIVYAGPVNGFRWPAHVIEIDLYARKSRERLLEQQASRPEFVHARRMAGLASNEDDPFVLGARRKRGNYQQGEQNETCCAAQDSGRGVHR